MSSEADLRQRVEKLTPQQRSLLARQLGDGALVAYVVPQPDTNLDAAQLWTALSEKLPASMIPSRFVLMDELPRTPNGKTDLKSLAERSLEPDLVQDGEQPVTETEKALARIWADVLRVSQVSRRANFFALGGDSILSIQVVSKARECGLQLAPDQIFLHPTLIALASELDGRLQEAAPLVVEEEEAAPESEFPDAGLDQAELDIFLDSLTEGSG